MALIVFLLIVFALVQLVIEIVHGLAILAISGVIAMLLACVYRYLLLRHLYRAVQENGQRTMEMVDLLRPHSTQNWRVTARTQGWPTPVASRDAVTEKIRDLQCNQARLEEIQLIYENYIDKAVWCAGIGIVLAPATSIPCLVLYGVFRAAIWLTVK